MPHEVVEEYHRRSADSLKSREHDAEKADGGCPSAAPIPSPHRLSSSVAPPGFYSQHSLGAPSTHHIGSVPDFFDPNLDLDATWLGARVFTLRPPSPLDPSSTEDDSPYPEVRAAVANFDDPNMPVSTLRAWLFGICWSFILPGINQFFYFRYPTISVSSVRAMNTNHI